MSSSAPGPALAAISADVEPLFRGAMRRLASGVALVTTADSLGNRHGIAMTAFMSLSMDPPSMLLAINRTASLCAPLLPRGLFAVNVLAAEQERACAAFVARPAAERFAGSEWTEDESGMPVVSGAVARIICAVGQAESFGSHMIVKGLVRSVTLGEDRAPLVYVSGRYGTVTSDG